LSIAAAHDAIFVGFEGDVLFCGELAVSGFKGCHRLLAVVASSAFASHAACAAASSGRGFGKVGLQGGEALGDVRLLLFAFGIEDHHAGLAAAEERLFDVGKEGTEGVKVAGGDGIEFVIVTLRAAGRLAHPGIADGADAVGEHALLVVLGLGAALLGAEEQAVEGGADAGLLIRIRQEVTGDLLDGEAVEGFVC
jgi:hypothetical protein